MEHPRMRVCVTPTKALCRELPGSPPQSARLSRYRGQTLWSAFLSRWWGLLLHWFSGSHFGNMDRADSCCVASFHEYCGPELHSVRAWTCTERCLRQRLSGKQHISVASGARLESGACPWAENTSRWHNHTRALRNLTMADLRKNFWCLLSPYPGSLSGRSGLIMSL